LNFSSKRENLTILKAASPISSRITKLAFILLLALLSASSSAPSAAPSAAAAFACACCAEPGEWYERTGKVESYEFEELRQVKFGKIANTYLTAVEYEDMKGFPANYESFALSTSLSARLSLTLTFKGERKETGSLVLALPKVATSFGADLHDMPEGSAGPILYKEWRFEGLVSGTGMFRKGMARGTKFQLILQGRGNNCLSSSDFKNWRLDIYGPRASYAFYGDLNSQ
jgi:hypothetical protein